MNDRDLNKRQMGKVVDPARILGNATLNLTGIVSNSRHLENF